MAMNIEQRLEQSAKSIEQSSQKAHDFAEKDTTIQTCAGSRDSLPKVSRIWQENFARQFNKHSTEFQDRFALSQQSLPWQASITISDSLQRYHVGVQGEEGYKEFLPNPLKLPFETAATLAEDLTQDRWLENGVPNKHWTESKFASALEKSLGVNARIWPKDRDLQVGDVIPSAQDTADGLPITHVIVDGNAYAMSPAASGLVADLTVTGATIGETDVRFIKSSNPKGRVSLDQFVGMTQQGAIDYAIEYLIDNFGGGEIVIPCGVWDVSVDLPSNITLVGFGEKSILRATWTGLNSYCLKMSRVPVGVYPYSPATRSPIKNAAIRDIVIDANGADFGLYMAYCLFPSIGGRVVIRNAKVRNLHMTAVFSWSIDEIILEDCQSIGGSIGENIFGWNEDEAGIICNAGNARRLIAFGNGKNGQFNKASAPTEGAGLLICGGSGNTFTAVQGEQNKGAGVYVMPRTQASFHGMYLEANGNDGTGELWQVVNESAAAMFYDVEPRFNDNDVFHAVSDTYIVNFLGRRITGPGAVSLTGKFSNVSVENPMTHRIKLSQATNVDSGGASTRHVILKPSVYSSAASQRTEIWAMGVFIALYQSVTIPAGRTIVVRNINNQTLETLAVPTGSYANGDVIYMPLLNRNVNIESLGVVNIGYGAGWTGIGQIDIGMYIELML
ncbi:hypothetical protein FLL76_00380 [Vibrio cholerae]|uniref:hypothetical protein n=1 Tax=Vibrio cholerae TaxID=666 RepID=UPI00115B7844|nr:hypothetical protein [Vibrio cholerae]TQP68436.1 hypothetical protein FLL76_00380 [Vibrio cholerae]